MTEQRSKVVTKHILLSTEKELRLRANYMLLFSIHGRAGETVNTEVRYYFDWEIVIDNEKKPIITMYQMRNKKRLPVSLFGNPK